MGHHRDEQGRFQSDRHPDLPPISFEREESWRALWMLAQDYEEIDPELAADIRKRLLKLGFDPESIEHKTTTQSGMTWTWMEGASGTTAWVRNCDGLVAFVGINAAGLDHIDRNYPPGETPEGWRK